MLRPTPSAAAASAIVMRSPAGGRLAGGGDSGGVGRGGGGRPQTTTSPSSAMGASPTRAEAVHEGGVDPAEHHRDPVRLAGERGRGHFVPRERAGPVSARRGGGKVGGRRPHPWPDGPRSPLPRGPLDRSPRCVTAGSPGADHWQTVRGDRRGRR